MGVSKGKGRGWGFIPIRSDGEWEVFEGLREASLAEALSGLFCSQLPHLRQ